MSNFSRNESKTHIGRRIVTPSSSTFFFFPIMRIQLKVRGSLPFTSSSIPLIKLSRHSKYLYCWVPFRCFLIVSAMLHASTCFVCLMPEPSLHTRSRLEGLRQVLRGGIIKNISSGIINSASALNLDTALAEEMFCILPLRAIFTRSFIRSSSMRFSEAYSMKDNIRF